MSRMGASQQNVGRLLLDALAASPDSYPHKLDPIRDCLLLLQFSAAAYSAASFLDDRVLTPAMGGAWVPLAACRAAVAAADAALAHPPTQLPLQFIFHSGHVGSTLLSRLVESAAPVGALLSLREPLPLRTLAELHDALPLPESLLTEEQWQAQLILLLRLWRRGYAPTRAVVLKATSTTGRIAPSLLRAVPEARAVYLNLRAESYLATLLAGQNSALDLRGHAAERARRLSAELSPASAAVRGLSPGELAAHAWLAERIAQQRALGFDPSRVRAIDFDALLADVPGVLAEVLRHFGVTADAASIDSAARGPVLTQYSKAPEHPYTPALRAEVLAESRSRNAAEIRRGLLWLDAVAAREPLAAELFA